MIIILPFYLMIDHFLSFLPFQFHIDPNLWFNLVMFIRRCSQLLCLFHTFVLSKSSSSPGTFPRFLLPFPYKFISLCNRTLLYDDIQIFGRPQWLTVRQRSHTYVNKVIFILHFEDKVYIYIYKRN